MENTDANIYCCNKHHPAPSYAKHYKVYDNYQFVSRVIECTATYISTSLSIVRIEVDLSIHFMQIRVLDIPVRHRGQLTGGRTLFTNQQVKVGLF